MSAVKSFQCAGEEIYWKDALNWIKDFARINPEFQHDLSGTDDVAQFALALQDGVILCDVLNTLHPNTVARIIRGPSLRAYQCKLNINAFLHGCAMHFEWTAESLFDPDELYLGARFERVVQTLAKVSHAKVCLFFNQPVPTSTTLLSAS
eukprot:m.1217996 g.1217996  ORF g.1217996 m.1217996 type:complete len:150 (-) comp24618_c0_seq6:270-719(-)